MNQENYYFEAKVSFNEVSPENGKTKVGKRIFCVKTTSFSSVEAMIYMQMNDLMINEFDVPSITRTKISEHHPMPEGAEGCFWFKVKVKYQLDGDKKNYITEILVESISIDVAKSKVESLYVEFIGDYKVIEVKETEICCVV